MNAAEVLELDNAAWLALECGEDAQPSETAFRWDTGIRAKLTAAFLGDIPVIRSASCPPGTAFVINRDQVLPPPDEHFTGW